MNRASRRAHAFTLVEMLVVISIIIILMGLLFPAFKGVQDQAKRTQAKNDLTQIVTAVGAYYTEYGKYPLLQSEQGQDTTFGENDPKTAVLMDVLRADGMGRDDPTGNNLNPRRIPFVSWPVAKDLTNPKSGIGPDGQPYDPWGKTYIVRIDGNYDNSVSNPYSQNAGFNPVAAGVIAWSFGRDGKGGFGDRKSADSSDDVISWQ